MTSQLRLEIVIGLCHVGELVMELLQIIVMLADQQLPHLPPPGLRHPLGHLVALF